MYTQPFPCLRTGTTMRSGKDVHYVWRDAGQWELWTEDVWNYGHSGASCGRTYSLQQGEKEMVSPPNWFETAGPGTHRQP